MRIIPARVAERWDFTEKKVCRDAASYIDTNAHQPLIPITRIKRTRVPTQAVLTEVHNLRQRFTRLRKLVADRGCSYSEFLRMAAEIQLEPYMVQGHDLYTLKDLVHIDHKGHSYEAFTKLTQLVAQGVDHVTECPECQDSAHFCKICASDDPFFVFDIDEFFSCPECGAAFHLTCFRRAGSECLSCLKLRAAERQPSIAPVRPR